MFRPTLYPSGFSGCPPGCPQLCPPGCLPRVPQPKTRATKYYKILLGSLGKFYY